MNTSFERSANGKSEWLTPPEIIKALGEFDLDPCAPVNRPWDTAKKHYTITDNGLRQTWEGRVWLNPPYGNETAEWMKRLAFHGDGIALTFARTETRMFFDSIWGKADAIFFLKGRLSLYNVDGTKSGTAGAPSCLIAYGEQNARTLKESNLKGQFCSLPSPGEGVGDRPKIVYLCGSTRFWREFQRASLRETMAGRIVLSIGAASGTDDEHFGNLAREEYDKVKTMLDELHKRKIDLADEVLVLNVDGYIGSSTRSEIEYAEAHGKPVKYLEAARHLPKKG